MKKNMHILILVMIVAVSAMSAQATAAAGKEYQIKAAFIYNFIKFIQWPEEESDQRESIKIAIIGEDPFGSSFDPIIQKTVKNKKIELVKFDSFEDIEDKQLLYDCQVVFVCKSEERNLSRIFESLNGRAILTISEIDDFADNGGMIGFKNNNNKVSFEINIRTMKAVNIKASSQLLKLALRVID